MDESEPKLYSEAEAREIFYAGLFDGEGCIGMYRATKAKPSARHKYDVTLRIGMTHRDTLARLQATFGAGTLRTYRIREGRQQSWVWFCGGKKEVIRILQRIEPHLDVKSIQARIALQYLKSDNLTDTQQEGFYRAMRLPKQRGDRPVTRNQYASVATRKV